MKIKAYAKINISLDVVGKRDDGYHLLEMIMQTIDLYDLIDINLVNTGIHIKSNKDFLPIDERNLAYKAAKLFINTYNLKTGVDINIYKNIPVAAGLAGGSTDAAAVLKAMRGLCKIKINDNELCALGTKLGADVPFFIKGGTALCKGIGDEIIQLNPFNNKILVLVKPNFGISTKSVYGNLDINKIYKHPNTKELIKAMEHQSLDYVARNMKNILENVSLRKREILRSIKAEMLDLGALGSMMSGSGPTIFGFFDDMVKAQNCYENLKKSYKDVFITRTIN